MSDRTTHDTRSTTRPRLVVLAVLAVVLLASVSANLWLISTRGLEVVGLDGRAADVQTERDAVMSQSRQFMLRMGTYGPDQLEGGRLPDYRDLVTEVITPKFATSFEQSVTAAEQLVDKRGVARQSEVFSTGVETLEDDRATALVAGAFTDSYPDDKGNMQPQEPVPYRMELTLVKTDGTWLVDDFNPVTGVDQ